MNISWNTSLSIDPFDSLNQSIYILYIKNGATRSHPRLKLGDAETLIQLVNNVTKWMRKICESCIHPFIFSTLVGQIYTQLYIKKLPIYTEGPRSATLIRVSLERSSWKVKPGEVDICDTCQ